MKKFDKEIDGHKYTTHSFPARAGLGLKIALLKLIAPSIASLIDNKSGFSSESLQRAVSELALKLDSGTVALVFQLLQYTRRDGKEISEESFDECFAGEYESLYKVLWFVIESNSFFGKGSIGALIKRAQTPMSKELSEKLSGDSTGTSSQNGSSGD